jgi:hypothetical protein
MKNKTFRFLALALTLALATPIILTQPGCKTAPSARVVEVQTLKGVGQSAEAAVALSAHLYQSNTITAAQARQVMDFYDNKFQPTFRVAVAAVNANLDSVASPDLISLAAQLSNLVIQLQNAPKPTTP